MEPEGFDDTARSLALGVRRTIEPGKVAICDALTARTPAPLTFAINQALGVQALERHRRGGAVCDGPGLTAP